MSRRAVPVRPIGDISGPRVGVISTLVPQENCPVNLQENEEDSSSQLVSQQQPQQPTDSGFGLLSFGFVGSLGLVWAWFYLRRKRQQEAEENEAFLHRLQHGRKSKKHNKRQVQGYMIDPSVLQNGAIYYPPEYCQQYYYQQHQPMYY